MSFQHILFDLDGTLTDSGPGIMHSAAYALSKYNIEIKDINDLRVFVGPPLSQTFPKFGIPESEIDNAIAYYREKYNDTGKFENETYPGIRELLEQLNKDGKDSYVATSKPEQLSKEILKRFDLAKYFKIIAGAEDKVRENKDDVIRYLLSKCPQIDDCVMVGDTVFDIVGANKLGIPAIGVSWGYGNVEEMSGALSIAHTPKELLTILETQNEQQ